MDVLPRSQSRGTRTHRSFTGSRLSALIQTLRLLADRLPLLLVEQLRLGGPVPQRVIRR